MVDGPRSLEELMADDPARPALTFADLVTYCLMLEKGLRHEAGKVRLLHGVLESERIEHARTEALLDLALDYLPDWTVDTRHGRALMRKDRSLKKETDHAR